MIENKLFIEQDKVQQVSSTSITAGAESHEPPHVSSGISSDKDNVRPRRLKRRQKKSARSTSEQEAVSDTYITPNPGYASFGIYTQIKEASQVLLWNSQGILVRQYTYQKGSSYNTDGLPSGLYVISVLNENGKNIGAFRWAKK